MVALLEEVLSDQGYHVEPHTDPASALESIRENAPALVLTDLRMGRIDGMTLLAEVKEHAPEVPVILITAFGSIDLAIEATRLGAYHFVTKPFRLKEVLLIIDRALHHNDIQRENERLRREVEGRYRFGEIIGKSRAMQEIFRLIEQVAETNANILVLGESGTGKELVAKALHYNSHRRAQAFVAVNCSALPEGLLESELFGHVRGAFTGAHKQKQGLFVEADQGTLFLDEIGDLSLGLQAKLLRVLQEKTIRPVGGNKEQSINTRIVAATHKDLRNEVREGRFREDLFYRLSVIPVRLPPLRERTEDINLLVDHFLERVANGLQAAQKSPTEDARRALMTYRWEGNVRELENVIERAHILSRTHTIRLSDLPEYLQDSTVQSTNNTLFSDFPTLEEVTRRYLTHVLEHTDGNKEEAAKIMGVDRRTIYRWRKRYELNIEDSPA
jgi:DNA-binding NtrC family response regulator